MTKTQFVEALKDVFTPTLAQMIIRNSFKVRIFLSRERLGNVLPLTAGQIGVIVILSELSFIFVATIVSVECNNLVVPE